MQDNKTEFDDKHEPQIFGNSVKIKIKKIVHTYKLNRISFLYSLSFIIIPTRID